MKTDSVTCLGVGDGTASADRNRSAYLYQMGGRTVLLDCGEPVSRSVAAAGLGGEAIDRIILSHLHSDHLGGLFMLLQCLWLEPRRKELRVHVPADAVGLMRQIQNAVFLFDELLKFRLIFEPVENARPISIGALTITPHLTTHLDGFKRSYQAKYGGAFESFSFLLEGGGRRVGHSADIGKPEDLEPLLAQPLDLLVCELAHFEPAQLFDYLADKQFGHLALIHLARPYWERREEIQRQAERRLSSRRITIARDQQVIPI